MKIILKLVLLYFVTCHVSFTYISSQPLVTQEWVARIQGPSNESFGPFFSVDKQGNSYVAGTHVVNDTINILCVKYNTSGVQQWYTLYKYPGEGYFSPNGLALDSSGNAYVVSRYGQDYLTTLNSLIVKFNTLNGSPVWAKRFITSNSLGSAFRDIKIDSQNNIYVVGWSESSHLVIKYNTNGDSLWVRKFFPVFGRERAYACTIDDSLNVILTGEGFSYPYGPLDSLIVAKYSTNGIFRWKKAFANNVTANVGEKVTTDQYGDIYIGGAATVSGYAVFLTMKYNGNGILQWAKIYDPPGSGDNYFRSLAIDRNNNSLYVTGGAVRNSFPVAVTIRYNTSNGDSIWVRNQTGTNNGGGARNMKLDTYGNSYITGDTYNYPSYIPLDIMTYKYSLQGEQKWLVTYNNNLFIGWDMGKQIELDNDNNIYILGTSQSSSQTHDYVLIKYSQLTGVQPISILKLNSFKLEQNYPNPFNPITKIQFAVPRKSFISLKVFDVLGRTIEELIKKELNASEYEISLDGSGYSSGIYFYQMIADDIIIDTKKFIVLK